MIRFIIELIAGALTLAIAIPLTWCGIALIWAITPIKLLFWQLSSDDEGKRKKVKEAMEKDSSVDDFHNKWSEQATTPGRKCIVWGAYITCLIPLKVTKKTQDYLFGVRNGEFVK